MPRQRRVQTPGFHHVGSRGNNKQEIFDDVLRKEFLYHLDTVSRAFDWYVYGWALMTNHFHLVLEIGELGLAEGMHRLNSWFALASNARFGRINHCVGGRYWNEPIESDDHLYETISYVMWNPVRAGVVGEPQGSAWTSYRPSAGLARAPRVLAIDRVLRLFGYAPVESHRRFSAFVDGNPGTSRSRPT